MLTFKRFVALSAGIVAGVAAMAGTASAQQLNAAGGTFPQPIYARWFQQYGQAHHMQINYQAIGSGGGIKEITAKAVDFGASDAPMTNAQVAAAPGIIHIPTVAGPVCMSYNIPGVGPGLHFTGPVIADIFLGRINNWDNPIFAKLNPGVHFPNLPILAGHRSDGSGTTNIFTTYLTDVSPAWAKQVGHGVSVRWPVGLGGKGNAGVAQIIQSHKGGFGYIELAYAVINNIDYGLVRNMKGNYIYPSVASTTIAVSGVPMPPDFRKVATNTTNPKGYPITGFTFILVYPNCKPQVKALLHWCLTTGQKEVSASPYFYAPLPKNIQMRALAKINALH